MQSQLRAENGIKEKVVGYVGYDWEPEADFISPSDFEALNPRIVKMEELPDDIRDVLLAENHRMATGEVLTVEQDKARREVSK
jgi:hypothetical protein